MNNKMKPVSFLNKEGLNLFGILHSPENNESGDTGIIILSPGIKSRVAPHRIYIKMARRFAALGFPVLRFDFYGLGDSEGEIEEKFTADLYGSIQVGRFMNDTKSAIDWMENNLGIKKIILAGLCGGAITGMLTNDERIESLIGLGIPVILDSSKALQQKYITEGELKSLRTQYIKKLFSPKAWMRFLSFRSDYLIFIKSILLLWKSSKKKQKKDKQASSPDNSNPYFQKSFLDFARTKKMLHVFSEADRLFWEFEEKFKNRYLNSFKEVEKNVDIHVVKEANHIFSFREWQEEMIMITGNWLDKEKNELANNKVGI